MRLDTDIQEQIVRVYLLGNSVDAVSAQTGVPRGTVYNCLRLRGIIRSNKINSRKYAVNHNFFESIDSEQQAYWLGFIQTDGYITSTGNKIGIALASRDSDHLEKFKRDVEATYPIKEYMASGYSNGVYSRILMTSEKMWQDLVNLGIYPNKTKNTRPIPVDKKLEGHYVRGLMDGDGSIKKSKVARSGYRGDFVSAQKCMAQYIADTLGKGVVRLDQTKMVWYSEFTLTEKNLEYLYEEATVYLSRKHRRSLRARARLQATSGPS